MWLILLIVACATMLTAKELTYYVDFERPNLTYFNTKYVEHLTITALRHSRRDPIHYVNIRGKLLVNAGNDYIWNGEIYEFLSNEYRPSMIRMCSRVCDFITDPKYKIFKPIYSRFFNISTCPMPKGEYNVMNISLSNVPLLKTFPLRKGRLHVTIFRTGHDMAIEAHIDFVIKERYL